MFDPVLGVSALFPFDMDMYGIRLYRFLTMAFHVSTLDGDTEFQLDIIGQISLGPYVGFFFFICF